MARANDVVPEWLTTPAISLAVYKMPEHALYAVGLSAGVACFVASSLPLLSHLLLHTRPATKWMVRLAFLAGTAAFFFLWVQAVVPLQGNMRAIVDDVALDPAQRTNATLTLQSMVHQGSAALFFLLAFVHGALVMYLLWHASPASAVTPRANACGFAAKALSLLAAISPAPISFFYHPGSSSQGGFTRDSLNFGGLMQWVSVLALVAFFASYACELRVVLGSRAARGDALVAQRDEDDDAGDSRSAGPPGDRRASTRAQ